MSIHKSKGLEFPVVILSDLARRFSNMDFLSSVLVHPQLGLGPVCVDTQRHIQYPTVARQALERTLRREYRFSLLRPVRDFATLDADDAVLLQGVVDCFFEEDGELVVVDFKTDRIGRTQIDERAEHYRPQLEAYSMALMRVMGKKVREKVLYFFSVGEEKVL